MDDHALDEVEESRTDALNSTPEKYGLASLEDLKERFDCAIAYREVLHTSMIFGESIHQFLLEHPCVLMDSTSYTLANMAFEALQGLYQRVGQLEELCDE